jgi:hypothetical protein
MPLKTLFTTLTACLLIALPLRAQIDKREPLTPAQVEEIREAGIYPIERVKLYTKYLSEHADSLKSLTSRAHSAARVQRIDNELKDFAALMDELGSNLDVYSDRHADIRAALKPLNIAIPAWQQILRALPGEPGFDLSRKDALESSDDLADQAKRLEQEQLEYFRIHKDEQGQDRAEPK